MKINILIKTTSVSLLVGAIANVNAQEVHHTTSVADDPSSSFHYIETRCEITRYDDYDDIECIMERLHMLQTTGQGTIINQTSRRDDTNARINEMVEQEAAKVEEYSSTPPPEGMYRVLSQGTNFIVINPEGERLVTTYDDLPLHIPYSGADELCSGTFCNDENGNITALNKYAFQHTDHYKNQIINEAEFKDGYYNVICQSVSDTCTVDLVNNEHRRVNMSELPSYISMASGNYECETTMGGSINERIPGPFCYEEGFVGDSKRMIGLNPDYEF
ncbi:MAG: hypothetical protein COA87_007055 [Halomonas sp.]|nr:hypothetical protein [Halomonas sp.]MBL1267497.1 hypothetical protein [Halomonas sp.]